MSIAARFAALASILVVVSAFTIGAILFRANSEILLSRAKTELSFDMEHAGQLLRESVALTRNEVSFLADLPQVKELAEGDLDADREQQIRAELTEIFYSLAQASSDLLQIRLIGVADNGRELVRVNRNANIVTRVADEGLQQKGNRNYVQETFNAAPGALLLFGIDLNKENGDIEVPHVAVLRVATPIYSRSGQIFGLVVVNLNMNQLLVRMRESFREKTSFYLVDAEGDFIVHHNPKKAFAFEFGDSHKLEDEFPELAEFATSGLKDGSLLRNMGEKGRQIVQISRQTLDVAQGREIFIAVAMLPTSVALGAGMGNEAAIVALTLFMAIFGAVAAMVTSRWLVEPLKGLSRATAELSSGETVEKLAVPVGRTDEIGALARSFTAMAHKLKERQDNLEENEQSIRAILETAGTPIITIDHAGIIQSANPATTRLLGYQSNELLGANVSLLMNDYDRERHDGYLADYQKTGHGHIVGVGREVEARSKDGEPIPIHLSVSVVKLRNGLRYTGVLTDLREQKKIARLKDEFVSTVSHELRTPLTSIKGALALVKSSMFGEMPGQAQQMIEIAHANSERLSRLVDDILDIEKIEAGKLTFHFQKVDLSSFLSRMVDSGSGHAKALGVSLELGDCPQDLRVHADPDRLAQVMSNLISNAIKFTPPQGKVEVSARIDKRRVRIEVTDQGPGVPEDFADKIFTKFAQADSSTTRASGGTGLGLAISKAIIDAHRGAIGFTPAAEKGTIFFVEVPRRRPKAKGKKAGPKADLANVA